MKGDCESLLWPTGREESKEGVLVITSGIFPIFFPLLRISQEQKLQRILMEFLSGRSCRGNTRAENRLSMNICIGKLEGKELCDLNK